jgi:hypothetical protein
MQIWQDDRQRWRAPLIAPGRHAVNGSVLSHRRNQTNRLLQGKGLDPALTPLAVYRPVFGIGLKVSSMPHDAVAVESAWTSNWAWGLPLTALTVAIRVTSIVEITVLLIRARRRTGNGVRGRISVVILAMVMIGATGWMLTVLQTDAKSAITIRRGAQSVLYKVQAMAVLCNVGGSVTFT